MPSKMTNDEFVLRLKQVTQNIRALDEYVDMYTNIRFICLHGHIFYATPHNILNRGTCPVCSGKKIVTGYNDLWSVRPDVAKLLQDPNDGYVNGIGSHKKTNFICPDCGVVSKKTISKVVQRGLSCDMCSDGISNPNKVLRYLLTNSYVDNIDFEFSPTWLRPKKYDGYFEKNGICYVVEMDGGIGHGNYSIKTRSQDVDGLKRDVEKDILAIAHNIEVIRIDCNYTDVGSRDEYIRSNLLNSKLNSLLNLQSIDWKDCKIFCMKSFMREAANMYNNGQCISDIASLLHVNRSTVRHWLKEAKSVCLCDYKPEESNKRKKQTLPSNATQVAQFTLDGVFINTYTSVAEAQRKNKVSNISACINGKQKSAGGYLWKKHSEV